MYSFLVDVCFLVGVCMFECVCSGFVQGRVSERERVEGGGGCQFS